MKTSDSIIIMRGDRLTVFEDDAASFATAKPEFVTGPACQSG